MEPLSLIALATAAGFVFKKMSGKTDASADKKTLILPRRSKITPGRLKKSGPGIDIDEISMVNANLLDEISAFLRKNRVYWNSMINTTTVKSDFILHDH